MSSRPCSPTTCATNVSTACSSVTSTAFSPPRSATTTTAPSASRRFTVAAPMPDAPPVTSATLPCRCSVNEDLGLLGEDHDDLVHVEDASLIRLHLLRIRRILKHRDEVVVRVEPLERHAVVRVAVAVVR